MAGLGFNDPTSLAFRNFRILKVFVKGVNELSDIPTF